MLNEIKATGEWSATTDRHYLGGEVDGRCMDCGALFFKNTRYDVAIETSEGGVVITVYAGGGVEHEGGCTARGGHAPDFQGDINRGISTWVKEENDRRRTAFFAELFRRGELHIEGGASIPYFFRYGGQKYISEEMTRGERVIGVNVFRPRWHTPTVVVLGGRKYFLLDAEEAWCRSPQAEVKLIFYDIRRPRPRVGHSA